MDGRWATCCSRFIAVQVLSSVGYASYIGLELRAWVCIACCFLVALSFLLLHLDPECFAGVD